jgi:hypothetical protein
MRQQVDDRIKPPVARAGVHRRGIDSRRVRARFSDVHVAPCGSGTFAAIRADSNVVWMIDARTPDVRGARTLDVPIRSAAQTRAESRSPDARRFVFTGIVGDSTGCALVAVRDPEGERPALDFYRIRPGSSAVNKVSARLLLPIGYGNDSIFAIDDRPSHPSEQSTTH